MGSETTYENLEAFVNNVRANGRYSFSWQEVRQNFSISDKALNQSLFRLKKKNKIARIRKGFYAIIVPEYSKEGMIPPPLFMDDLMKSLGKSYYVGLFSAAALHGAAHQQPMEYYVITQKPALRNIRTNKLKINFFVKKKWPEQAIVQKKTDAGYMQVSSPELTAIDLLAYGDFGINRVLNVLEELSELMKPSDLFKIANNNVQTSTIQRLGYLIDKITGNKKLSESLKRVLKSRKIHPVPLLKNASNKGSLDTDWNVIINTDIYSDK